MSSERKAVPPYNARSKKLNVGLTAVGDLPERSRAQLVVHLLRRIITTRIQEARAKIDTE